MSDIPGRYDVEGGDSSLMHLDFAHLKARQREIRDGFPESLGLRTHRALSWLNRAEQETTDTDARFIFLWIAFNAAYAQEMTEREGLTEHRIQDQEFRGQFTYLQLAKLSPECKFSELHWSHTYK